MRHLARGADVNRSRRMGKAGGAESFKALETEDPDTGQRATGFGVCLVGYLSRFGPIFYSMSLYVKNM